ncbi:PspC domain-containing protein [Elongatibacter sediminis]|uniref:PspC domain-containing protein n=1 Tax=Elongatibacter sediminis TaxID=3119006 RepID=A0AAW9RAX5_9GAMM
MTAGTDIRRPIPRPVLAGVCSRLAARLRWNVWGIRAALLVLLAVKPLAAAVVYLAAAGIFSLLRRHRRVNGEPADKRKTSSTKPDWRPHSPELAEHARRIEELHRRLDRL